ncbi:MAG: amidohydrolase, partial [Candidatus Heimdallarchaeota archaeon]|nr:amidohydrolase [Candidatus Heimdallarchaeota archaeon]
LGVAGIGAAFAIKKELESGKISGTIRYYGCPAEENYNAKGWMVVNGLFDDVDIGLTWHPMSYNANWGFSTNAINDVLFKFHGISAHASGDPYNGRSALDAVELMNVGVNYLREHMIPDARIHYIITHGGGAPNVVPAFAESYYFIRAPERHMVEELYQRVIKVAKGAAMMTETELEIDFLSGTYNTHENSVIGNVIGQNMREIGAVSYTDQELEFANKIRESLPTDAFEKTARLLTEELKARKDELAKKPILEENFPTVGSGLVLHGSTDVSDVSWVVPLAQFSTATQVNGSPGHSWQNVATGRMSIGHKGMIFAAKILATTAFDFMISQELVDEARLEFTETHKERKYESPFPDDHKPPYRKLKKDILQYTE